MYKMKIKEKKRKEKEEKKVGTIIPGQVLGAPKLSPLQDGCVGG